MRTCELCGNKITQADITNDDSVVLHDIHVCHRRCASSENKSLDFLWVKITWLAQSQLRWPKRLRLSKRPKGA